MTRANVLQVVAAALALGTILYGAAKRGREELSEDRGLTSLFLLAVLAGTLPGVLFPSQPFAAVAGSILSIAASVIAISATIRAVKRPFRKR